MAVTGLSVLRRLRGFQDSRSNVGRLSRGNNMYPGGNAANPSGRNQYSHNDPGSRQRQINKWNWIGATKPLDVKPLQDRASYQPVGQPQPFNQPAFSPTFNPQFAEARRRIMQQMAGLNSEEELQRRRIGEDFNASAQDLNRWREQNIESLQDRLAAQGILRSGINIGEQGKIGDEYQRNLEGLYDTRSRTLEDLSRQLLSQRQGYEQQLADLDMQQARMEQEIRRQEAQRQAERIAEERAAQRQQQMYNQLMQETQPKLSPTGAIKPPSETPDQRLARIAQEIMGGQRSFDNVRSSINRLAGITNDPSAGKGAAGDQLAVQGGLEEIKKRIAAIFGNRGVSLTQYQPR